MKKSEGRSQRSGILIVATRLLVSGLFLYSGWIKVLDVETFAQSIAGYQLAPEAWILPTAYVLPWLEIWCAVALWVTPPFRKSAWILLTAMLVVFTLAKISALQRGLDISCGCTGSDDPMTWLDVGSNLVWLVVSSVGLVIDKRG
jgi:uncharacterized membrane protein YphA (DoxX/SURF4 family)